MSHCTCSSPTLVHMGDFPFPSTSIPLTPGNMPELPIMKTRLPAHAMCM